jgi:hypothetical protein
MAGSNRHSGDDDDVRGSNGSSYNDDSRQQKKKENLRLPDFTHPVSMSNGAPSHSGGGVSLPSPFALPPTSGRKSDSRDNEEGEDPAPKKKKKAKDKPKEKTPVIVIESHKFASFD